MPNRQYACGINSRVPTSVRRLVRPRPQRGGGGRETPTLRNLERYAHGEAGGKYEFHPEPRCPFRACPHARFARDGMTKKRSGRNSGCTAHIRICLLLNHCIFAVLFFFLSFFFSFFPPGMPWMGKTIIPPPSGSSENLLRRFPEQQQGRNM